MAASAPLIVQEAPKKVHSVLFLCAMNAVRSPMAEALARHYFGHNLYVRSAGIRHGEPDVFTNVVLGEIGIDLSKHKVTTLDDLIEWEGLNFDLAVTLSPEAHHAALELTRTNAIAVEYWPTQDATIVHGSREQILDSYRRVRDSLDKRIIERFSGTQGLRGASSPGSGWKA